MYNLKTTSKNQPVALLQHIFAIKQIFAVAISVTLIIRSLLGSGVNTTWILSTLPHGQQQTRFIKRVKLGFFVVVENINDGIQPLSIYKHFSKGHFVQLSLSHALIWL